MAIFGLQLDEDQEEWVRTKATWEGRTLGDVIQECIERQRNPAAFVAPVLADSAEPTPGIIPQLIVMLPTFDPLWPEAVCKAWVQCWSRAWTWVQQQEPV